MPLRRIFPFLLIAAAAVGCVAFGRPSVARGDVDCTPRTAWAGSETTPQRGQATLVQLPSKVPVRLTHIHVSTSFAEKTKDFGEELMKTGISDVPLTLGPNYNPITTVDPSFDPVKVLTTASAHNEDPNLTNGVIAADIHKSDNGNADPAPVDLALDHHLPAGGVVWVRYDTLSSVNVPTDPEVQIVLTYVPDGC